MYGKIGAGCWEGVMPKLAQVLFNLPTGDGAAGERGEGATEQSPAWIAEYGYSL